MTLEDELEKVSRENAPDVDSLGRLGELVKDMMAKRLAIAEVENQLAGMKRDFNELAIGKIPGLMEELGLSEVKTQEGARVIIQREVQCKFIPERKVEGLQWLDDNNHGAIVKHQLSLEFGKNSEAAVDRAVTALMQAGFVADVSKDVHPMTLKAWGKRQVEDGASIPSELFNVSVFSMARVKS